MKLQISHLLKVLLLLLGVGVVEAHDELAFKCDLVVLVKQGSFGVSNVQVSVQKEAQNKFGRAVNE